VNPARNVSNFTAKFSFLRFKLPKWIYREREFCPGVTSYARKERSSVSRRKRDFKEFMRKTTDSVPMQLTATVRWRRVSWCSRAWNMGTRPRFSSLTVKIPRVSTVTFYIKKLAKASDQSSNH